MLQEQVPRRIRPGTRYQDFYNYPNKTYDEHIEQPLGVSQWIEQAARQWALRGSWGNLTHIFPSQWSPKDLT